MGENTPLFKTLSSIYFEQVFGLGSLNRINLDKLMETSEAMKGDPGKAVKTTRVEGEWLLDLDSGPQFRAVISADGGEFILEADQPKPLGGGGSRPSPIHYCLYGIAACTAATFATIAASEGIRLRKMRVVIENKINFSRPLGLSDEPIVEGVNLEIFVDTDAGDEDIERLKKLTIERCPAIYCVTNPIKMELSVNKATE